MKIERLRIKNFKTLRNIDVRDIPNFCIVVGANGAGKSTLFNVFAFLQEALRSNVNTALIKQGGSKGFAEVRSRDATGNIEIEIKYRAKQTKKNNPLITYFLSIGEEKGKAVVRQEILKYRKGEEEKPRELLNFKSGKGIVFTYEATKAINERVLKIEQQFLKEKDILAIKGLAQFKKFPEIATLGNLIEQWHLSDIHITQVRNDQQSGAAEHLSRRGNNLSLVIDYLHQNHKEVLAKIIQALKHRIPGIENVTLQTLETGKLSLKIKNSSFKEPFLVQHVSDGTIKMLAYLVLLYDPNPLSLLCVEEPENQLYPRLLEELAEEFRQYAIQGKQVFVSTHSPDFLNAARLEEVFLFSKDKDGYASIKAAKDDAQLKKYMEAGDKMGWLWKEGFFKGVDPE